MNILITGAASRLGKAIAAELEKDHQLRLLDSVFDDVPFLTENNAEFMKGSILDPETVWKAVRNIDALIHTGEPPQHLPEVERHVSLAGGH